MSKDLAEWCGYTSVFDMLKDNLTNDELLDLLCEYIHEDSSGVSDIIEEIAKEKFEWFDHERARADHEDAQYQAYKDGEFDD